MKLPLKLMMLLIVLTGALAGCSLFGEESTPVVLPPTQPVVLVFPTPIQASATPLPVTLAAPTAAPTVSTAPAAALPTPTFPPILTATALPVTPTVTRTPPPGATQQPALKLSRVNMHDLNRGWAVGQVLPAQDEQILVTSNGGKNWKKVTPPEGTLTNKKAVTHFLDATHAWVIYAALPAPGGLPAQFTLWRTADAGASWKSADTSLSGLTADYFSPDQLAFSDANNGWLMAILGNGMSHTYFAVYQTADGGTSWKLIVSPDKDNAPMTCSKSGLWFRDASHGYLSGNCFGVVKGLYFYATQDGGATWKPVNLPAPAGLADAYTKESYACGADAPRFFDAQKGLVVVSCSDLVSNKAYRWVYQTKDGGSTWSSAALPRGFGTYAFLNSDTGWYLGQTAAYATTNVLVYTTNDGGKSWKQISATNWVGDMDYVDAKNGWIIARSGSELALVRTSDGGLTYQVIIPQIP